MRFLKLFAVPGVMVALLAPAFAQSATDAASNPAPTADSAAKQVGKTPKSAIWHGKKVQPSERLPSSDQVKREQPGTVPPQPGGRATTTAPDDSNATKENGPAVQSPSQLSPN
ncbi:hypothetical protein [Acetobacter oeni]|uniref:Serine/threonine protein kinase n=1 Tax=Acetobacter oeni TaxID=304077 RepID=A0A511XGS5_9PROT|nr:hypothetical protein [Acetobacter oeni]MBB3881680.1 hypothetical protein [Acetobacter oeni]NHO17515.1 hypothetical protein [Acetobacter oeni]GBR06038.1 hypothetical protein AA21952_1900 [Acetobacter oeni LMG 21952]GEN62150.1 hypothetical protein AOE01nite_03740 [Acetobacter oeni]